MSARPLRPARRLLAVALAGVPLTLCAAAPAAADRGSQARHDPVGDPVPARLAPGPVRVDLTPVTTAVTAPLKGLTAPGHDDELFVVDQVGILWSLDVSTPAAWPVAPQPVLDVSDLTVGPDTPTDERGFLGAAFSPNFLADGMIYTDTSEPFDPSHPATFPLRHDDNPCLAGFPQTPDHIDVGARVASSPIRTRRTSPSTPRRPARAVCSSRSTTRRPITTPVISHFGPDDGLPVHHRRGRRRSRRPELSDEL